MLSPCIAINLMNLMMMMMMTFINTIFIISISVIVIVISVVAGPMLWHGYGPKCDIVKTGVRFYHWKSRDQKTPALPRSQQAPNPAKTRPSA